MSANEVQVGGDHYKGTKDEQPWDFIERNGLGFMEGNIVKYMTRWRSKGGSQDLHKVLHYISKLEELHHEDGREPRSDGAGQMAVNRFLDANGVADFRERIVISIFASRWTFVSFAHAQLLVQSLIAFPDSLGSDGEGS